MKTVITLDPEYIPWDSDAHVVRLRRRHNKKLRLLVSVGGAILLMGGGLLFTALNKPDATPAPVSTATPLPTAQPETALPTPVFSGKPGHLTLVRDNVAAFFPTLTYTVTHGDERVAGDTVHGPVVVLLGPAHVELDHGTFEY